jgi:hypothetical protein
LFVSLLFAFAYSAGAEAPKFIDTQAQFHPGYRDYAGTVQVMLKEMDRVGISKTLLVPFPLHKHGALRYAYDAEEFSKVVRQYPTRFGFLAGGGTLNVMILEDAPDDVSEKTKAAFRRRCEEILALGALGFGEVTARHLSLSGTGVMGDLHAYESAAPDHPLLLLLADIAAENDVPIDIHFDVFPETIPTPSRLQRNNPPVMTENLQAFERLLAHNRKARISWAHLGSDPARYRTPELMRELLTRHPNLYSAFRIMGGGPLPIAPLDEAGQLKPIWAALIKDFPDRFTMHTDIFYQPGWPPDIGPKNSHELAKKLLEQLPPELARKLAYENTQRIYKLKD